MSRISCHKLSQITVPKWYTYHGPSCCFPKGYAPTTRAHSGMKNAEKKRPKNITGLFTKMHGAKIKPEGQNFSEWNRSASKSKNTLVLTTKGSMKTKFKMARRMYVIQAFQHHYMKSGRCARVRKTRAVHQNKISSTQSHPTRSSHMGASLQVHVLNCASSTKAYTGNVWQCKYCALEPLFRSDVWVTIQFSTKHTNWLGP